MNLTGIIESAEKEYKQILEEFFISVYDEKSLSSHGIDHHRRVWNNSKELLNLVPLRNTDNFSQFAYDLIIASYLHDIGMSVDPGEKHGKLSRDLCMVFLAKNNLSQTVYKNALETIEHHDNKNYTGSVTRSELFTILSAADDLDAFGYTGIYRYSEIYLTRKINSEKLGDLILENAGKRFDNFVKTFGSENEIVEKHRFRYEILKTFFSKYNEELLSYHFGSPKPYGCCGVIETILQMMNNKLGLKDVFENHEVFSGDPMIISFFTELEKELFNL